VFNLLVLLFKSAGELSKNTFELLFLDSLFFVLSLIDLVLSFNTSIEHSLN